MADIPQITLPEVVITPEPSPPSNAMTAGKSPGGTQPGIALDNLTAARASGHDWEDIHKFLNDGTSDALARGHSPASIDTFLGYSAQPEKFFNAIPWQERLQDTTAMSDPAMVRRDYADALANGVAKSAQDFANKYVGSYEDAVGPLGDRKTAVDTLASGLHGPEEVVDGSIKMAADSDMPFGPDALKAIRGHYFNGYAETGASPNAIAEGYTTPDDRERVEWERHLRTQMPELFTQGKDEINSVFFVPGEELPYEKSIGSALFDFSTDVASLTLAGKAHLLLPLATSAMEHLPVLGELLADTSGAGKPSATAMRIARAAAMNKKAMATTGEIADEIHKVTQGSVMDKVEMMQRFPADGKLAKMFPFLYHKAASNMKKEWMTKEAQEGFNKDIEQRLIDPEHEFKPETQEYLKEIKDLTDEDLENMKILRERLPPGDLEELTQNRPLLGVGGGYARRSLVGDSAASRLASPVGDLDVVKGTSTRSLSTQVNANRARKFYVLEGGESGARTFSPNTLDQTEKIYGEELKYGQELQSQTTGERYIVKQPTTEEIEKAGADGIPSALDKDGEPFEFNKNHFVNLVNSILQQRSAIRNLNLLDRIKTDMVEQKLFVQTERQLRDKRIRIAPNPEQPLAGSNEEPWVKLGIPNLDEYWARQHIAEVLNDFYPKIDPANGLTSKLRSINRFLVGALFATPFPHIANVGAHWGVGRGFDWVPGSGGWKRLAQTAPEAIKQVMTLGPMYQEMARGGSSLLRGGVETENFTNFMMKKVFNEQLADPDAWAPLANKLGFAGKGATAADASIDAVRRMVKAEYRWSRKSLWSVGDMFMLQRQMELQMRGLSQESAIRMAEKDIPNYRIPSRIFGSRALSEALRDPNVVNFGRYKYGQIKSLMTILPDLMTGSDLGRTDAAAKLAILGSMAFGVYPMLDKIWQHATGNQFAETRRSGPFSVLNSAGNYTGPQKSWIARTSSFLSLAPATDIAVQALSGKNVFGQDLFTSSGKVISARHALEGVEWAGSNLYPLGAALDLARGRGADVATKALGIGNVPDISAKIRGIKAQQYQIRDDNARIRNDQLNKFLNFLPKGAASGSPVSTNKFQDIGRK